VSHDAGQRCACVSEHRPAPLELDLHHVLPRYLNGPDTEDNTVWTDPVCHRNIHEILRLLMAGGRRTYTQINAMYEQPVNRYAYTVALRGFDLWLASLPDPEG